jgi:hypothetical protein
MRAASFSILLLSLMSIAARSEVLTLQSSSSPFKEIVIALYQGQNTDISDDLIEQPKLRENLIKLFGYTRYQRVGIDMVYPHSFSPVTAWPNKLFSLTVNAVDPDSPRYVFELKLEEKSVLKGSFIPKAGIPIIIKGPLYGAGQLILVVDAGKR